MFFYDLRRDLGLAANEYLVADVVDHLSGTASRVPGWCYASRGYMARTIGVSRRTVQSLIARLESKGIVERHSTDRALLRTTVRWKTLSGQIRSRLR